MTANFFQQAPPLNSLQKRFVQSIVHKHNVVGSFPEAFPDVSIYALSALMGQGLVIVACPDRAAIRRHLAYFEKLGYRFPDVVALDGSQVPHEERGTYEAINYNKVHLLFTIPETFNTLNFLNMMVHAAVNFMVIESAQFLLPDFAGSYRYEKLFEGFERLVKRPTIVLLSQPLPKERLEEMAHTLKLKDIDWFEEPPLWEKATLTVAKLVTEEQKYRYLKRHMPTPTGGGRAVICVADTRAMDALVRTLQMARYGHVMTIQPSMAPAEREKAEARFLADDDTIAIYTGYDPAVFRAPIAKPGATADAQPGTMKIFYWQPPVGVDALLGHVFMANSPPETNIEAHVLYTKEDYQHALSRLTHHTHHDESGNGERVMALKRYRRWVLSKSCRRQTIAAYQLGSLKADIAPCGVCDCCTAKPVHPLKRLIEPFLY